MKNKLTYRFTDRSEAGLKELLKAYEQSGLMQREFARQIGIGYSTLTKWIRCARQVPSDKTQSSTQFIPVKTIGPLAGRSYHMRHPEGWTLEVPAGFEAEEVKTLLSLLPPCSA